MDKAETFLLGITAGGVNEKGLPTWLTLLRLREMFDTGISLEKRGYKVYYACVPSAPKNDAHRVLRSLCKTLHPQYDGEVLTPPDGLHIKKQKERDLFLHRTAIARQMTAMVITAF